MPGQAVRVGVLIIAVLVVSCILLQCFRSLLPTLSTLLQLRVEPEEMVHVSARLISVGVIEVVVDNGPVQTEVVALQAQTASGDYEPLEPKTVTLQCRHRTYTPSGWRVIPPMCKLVIIARAPVDSDKVVVVVKVMERKLVLTASLAPG